MKKQFISNVFGRDIYLLGTDKQGIKYWLESPKWDCNWYWGFGYIETYIDNNSPKISEDISSHSHFNGDTIKGIVNWTIPLNQRIQLKRSFNEFYEYKKEAEETHRINPIRWKEINVIHIPNVIDQIIAILTPEGMEPIKCNIPIIKIDSE
jgi:hypothetical protein